MLALCSFLWPRSVSPSFFILESPLDLRVFFGLPTTSLGMLSNVYAERLFLIASHPLFAVNNTMWFHDYWDQLRRFIWDHSFETTFIWGQVHLRPIHLRPLHLRQHSYETFSFETTFVWDHIRLRPHSFETTVIWDHSHLRPHSFETTFFWDHIHLRPHSFETTFICDRIYLRPLHLRPHSLETTPFQTPFILSHIHFRLHSFEVTFILRHAKVKLFWFTVYQF